MEPKCPKCGSGNISDTDLIGGKTILVYCTNCGHIIGWVAKKD